MIACLPAYDLPEIEGATDEWWQHLRRGFLRAGLNEVPTERYRPQDFLAHFENESLLFSQCCGYPYLKFFSKILLLVGTPVYNLPGCEGPNYRSFIIVRHDEEAKSLLAMRGRRCAVNAPHSQSGYNCLRAALSEARAPKPLFAQVIETGSHIASLEAVAEVQADLAAIDCVTLGLIQRYRPSLVQDLRILAQTMAAPALPYVTGGDADCRKRLREGLLLALNDPASQDCRQALGLRDVRFLEPADYLPILDMEARAVELGYTVVA